MLSTKEATKSVTAPMSTFDTPLLMDTWQWDRFCQKLDEQRMLLSLHWARVPATHELRVQLVWQY